MVFCVLTCTIFTSCITENNYNMGFGGTSEEDPGFGGSISSGVSGYETNGVGGDDEESSNTNYTSSTNSVTSSSSGEPECIPGTCEEIGAECGEIFDGCGNYIPCGRCILAFGETECGTERFENGVSVGRKPNLCGGGCVYKTKEAAPINCNDYFEGEFNFYFSCTPLRRDIHEMYGGCKTIDDWTNTCCKNAP